MKRNLNCVAVWFACLGLALIIGFGSIIVTALTGGYNKEANYYARTVVVVGIDESQDLVTVVDAVGYEWQFTGCDDCQIGDSFALVMDTNGTESILDDEIVNIHYERIDLLMAGE